MPTTTRKHRDFVRESMKKPVTALPGIGPVLGQRLRNDGYITAGRVMAEFVLLGGDPEEFKNWLQRTTGANPYHAGLCTRAMTEWCGNRQTQRCTRPGPIRFWFWVLDRFRAWLQDNTGVDIRQAALHSGPEPIRFCFWFWVLDRFRA
ncbi:barrier-to-autointegration factor-like protein [Cololabis saira]|uniref:barrier-to-autointegration factor-like protein n=1 Tax=Cololabis saira TaxID=129043 RepID=UPI002AD20A2E|nr:barrier-to-autointegration factor-like protein [Cololabis saira]XP_061599752.1 barrier-to-autointegration factor-like protein [Cololabis saira]XP_061599753.1 barrier-to-autointegration factor-like protein [Cololabis saira]XP_061599754.1 barrier-to-autointegration factor-like protein [Cololabis saira]